VIHSSLTTQELLGRLHDSHRLYTLASTPQDDARAELSGIMSDLLSIELNVSERELVVDVLMGFLRQAEKDLRRAVAERLSVIENVPLRIILNLANDDIEVADPILRRSRVLTDMDLIYVVKANAETHARAVATRPNISEKLIDVLAEANDVETAITLTENKSITLTENALHNFTELAKTSERLAKPLTMCDEISEELAMELYDFVGAEIKTYIRSNFDLASNGIAQKEIDKAVHDLSASLRGNYIPTSSMIALAEDMMRRDSLAPDVLVENLRRGQVPNFIAMFSVYCALPIPTVIEILQQERGQGLAVACKATGIQKADFVNIYLMTARLRKSEIITQSTLAKALSYFDRIKGVDARAILKQSRH
jgi:uncharacterized protein (DUF2336 family)